jgi:hypothetical protein
VRRAWQLVVGDMPDEIVPYHPQMGGAGHSARCQPDRRTIQPRTRSLVAEVPLTPEPSGHDAIRTDLVEYFVVVVRNSDSLATMVPAVSEVVRSSAIRILDLVAVTTDSNGVAQIIEVDALASFDAIHRIDAEIGGLLSAHDIDLISLALTPDSAAIVLVVEDSWAEPLSTAARQSGGEVLVGERIPRSRIEAALADEHREGPHGQRGTDQDIT